MAPSLLDFKVQFKKIRWIDIGKPTFYFAREGHLKNNNNGNNTHYALYSLSLHKTEGMFTSK